MEFKKRMRATVWHRRRRIRGLAKRMNALVLVFAMAIGCGPGRDGSLPPTAPVTGTVMLQGEPVRGGTVTFHPKGAGNPGVGWLDEEGHFSVATYYDDDGAVVGEHSVTVDMPPPLDGVDPNDVFDVPEAYTNPEATPLIVNVPDEGIDDIKLVLEE